MTDKQKLVPVATLGDATIFFTLNPVGDEDTGAIQSGDTIKPISFWAYVTKKPITPIIVSLFHEALWRDTLPSPEWEEAFVNRTIPPPALETTKATAILVDPLISVPQESIIGVKSLKALPRRMEPYDPNARDGDNDGLVQDGTPWERPAGTRILNNLGQELAPGFSAMERPIGSRIVDENGNEVAYRPKDQEPEVPNRLTPGDLPKPRSLRDSGYPTVDERRHPERGELDRREAAERERAREEREAVRAQKERAAEAKRKDDFVPPEDVRSAPGVSEDSLRASRVRVPERPDKPIPPLPVAFQGKMRDWAVDADGNYEALLRRLDREGYVVLDYETTGWAGGATNRPVQIGAVRMLNGRVVERFNVFVNPDERLGAWSRENLRDANGEPLTDDWLAENGLLMRDAHAQLAEFLGDSVVVAHNLPFDFDVMNRMMREGGIDFVPEGTLDTLKLTREMLPAGDGDDRPRSHKLVDLAEFYGVNYDAGPHRADVDAEITGSVLRRALTHGETGDLDRNAIMPEFQEMKFASDYERFEARKAEYDADLREYEAAVIDRDEDATRGMGRIRSAVSRMRDRVRRRRKRDPEQPSYSASGEIFGTPEEVLGERAKRSFDDVASEFNGAWEKNEDGSYVYEVWTPTGAIADIPLAQVVGLMDANGEISADDVRELLWSHGASSDVDQVREAARAVERQLDAAGLRVQARSLFGGDWTDGIPEDLPREYSYRILDKEGNIIEKMRLQDLLSAEPRMGTVSDDSRRTRERLIGVDIVPNQNLEEIVRKAQNTALATQLLTAFKAELKDKIDTYGEEAFFFVEQETPTQLLVSISPEIYGLPRVCPPLEFRIQAERVQEKMVLRISATGVDSEAVDRMMEGWRPYGVTINDDGEMQWDEIPVEAADAANYIVENRKALEEQARRDYEKNQFFYDDREDKLNTQKQIDFWRSELTQGDIDEFEFQSLIEVERVSLGMRRAQRRRQLGVNRNPDEIAYPIAPGPNGRPIRDLADPENSEVLTDIAGAEFEDIIAVVEKAYNIEPLAHPFAPGQTRVTEIRIIPKYGETVAPETTNFLGAFHALTDMGETIIEVNENKLQNPRLTFMHELGHRADAYTDEDGFFKYYSEGNTPAAVAFREQFEIQYADQIEELRNDPTRNVPRGANGKTYFDYWTSPREAFARTHEMWLASLAGDADEWLPGSTGAEALEKARPLFPYLEELFAERGLAVVRTKETSISEERQAALNEAKAVSDAAIPEAGESWGQVERANAGQPDTAKIGFYDKDGNPILVRVPVGANGIESERDAVRHLAAGGDIRDVPDGFLQKAIQDNSSTDPDSDLRFFVQQVEHDSGNRAGHFHYLDKVTGARFGIKYADGKQGMVPGGQENFCEVFGTLLAHRLGFEQGAQRILAKDDELTGLGNGRDRIPWLYEFLPFDEFVPVSMQLDIQDADELARAFTLDEIIRGMILNYLLMNGDRHPGNVVLISDPSRPSGKALGYWDHGLGMGYINHIHSDEPDLPLDEYFGIETMGYDRFGYAEMLREKIRMQGDFAVSQAYLALVRVRGQDFVQEIQEILDSIGPENWPGIVKKESDIVINEWRRELETLQAIDPETLDVFQRGQRRALIAQLESKIEKATSPVTPGTRGDWRTILDRARRIMELEDIEKFLSDSGYPLDY